ncbi:MAG: hypothetical protein K2I46_05605 [Clostridia bacterium]|nr:hypothetical protein [Clostridia bacterium]
MNTQNIKNRLAEAIQNSNCDIPKLAKQLGISQNDLKIMQAGKLSRR